MAELLPKPAEITEEIIESTHDDEFGGLKEKYRLFIREYLRNGNYTSAARAAGYTEENARNTGLKILKNPEVVKVIQKLRTKIQKRLEYTEDAAIKAQKDLIQMAIDAKQFTAVAKMKEHLDVLTGHWDPNKIEVKGLAPLSINIFGIKPPSYAQEELDVTPRREGLTGKAKPDSKGE